MKTRNEIKFSLEMGPQRLSDEFYIYFSSAWTKIKIGYPKYLSWFWWPLYWRISYE